MPQQNQQRIPETPRSTENNGIQYQKDVLSQEFSETKPDSQGTPTNFVGGGLNLIPAPKNLNHVQPSQQQGGYGSPTTKTSDTTPRPVYGVPLAPVIGLDSNENLQVVEEQLQDGVGAAYAVPTEAFFTNSHNKNCGLQIITTFRMFSTVPEIGDA